MASRTKRKAPSNITSLYSRNKGNLELKYLPRHKAFFAPATPSQSEPESTQGPLCRRCGNPMRRFTARKTGRPYVKCDDCDILNSERDIRIPNCYCGQTAKLRTAHTRNNDGRKFRGCGKPMSSPDRCSFFYWVEP